jgi:hypothetical protein
MAKRGRKPSNKRKGYFYEEEEQAVLDYLNTDDAFEKNQIYCDKLKPAFEKMIESIIRRYKLFLNEEYEDTFNDTLSNLLTKLDKFKPGKYKAFSYYGTICKNYLLGRIDTQKKQSMRNPSYDSASEEFNTLKYSDLSDKSAKIAMETVDELIKRLKNMVDNPDANNLKASEIKLGKALINLFENWDYVLTTDASDKLNKNAILLFLRETTGLDTKGIRDNMKKFKKEFLIIKDYVIS